MATFIEIGHGSINIEEVRHISMDGRTLTLKTGDTVEAIRDATTMLMQLVPAVGDWEVLWFCPDGDEPSVDVAPLVAWGLRISGDMVPVTPLHPDGQWDKTPGVRRKGTAEIFDNFGRYDDEADFLKSHR